MKRWSLSEAIPDEQLAKDLRSLRSVKDAIDLIQHDHIDDSYLYAEFCDHTTTLRGVVGPGSLCLIQAGSGTSARWPTEAPQPELTSRILGTTMIQTCLLILMRTVHHQDITIIQISLSDSRRSRFSMSACGTCEMSLKKYHASPKMAARLQHRPTRLSGGSPDSRQREI